MDMNGTIRSSLRLSSRLEILEVIFMIEMLRTGITKVVMKVAMINVGIDEIATGLKT